ncbi:MAG: SPOR domain-containing protein [Xenococcaceae cyanobacterium]
MSQFTSVDFSGQSSLNPALKAALSSLDLQLEDELARYERQRAEHPVKPNAHPEPQQAIKPRSLVNQESTAELIPNSPPSPQAENTQATDPEQTEQAEQLNAPEGATEIASGSEVFPFGNSTDTQSLSKDQLFSLVHQPSQAGEDYLFPSADNQTPPDDYIESSERLLSISEEKEPVKETDGSLLDNLLTPLGIGSMLLLVVASAFLGSALIAPEIFSLSGLAGLFNSKSSTRAQSPTETESVQVEQSQEPSIPNGPNLATKEFIKLDLGTLSTLEPHPSPSVTPSLPTPINPATTPVTPRVAPSPVVASEDSSDLATALLPPSLHPQLGNPNVVPPSSAPVPSPTASAQPSQLPAPKTIPTITPQASPPPEPVAVNPPPTPKIAQPSPSPALTTRPTITPQASPSPEPVAVNPPPVSRNDNYYYVLADYSGDRSLEQARLIVKDAYLSSFPQGIRIQMGAFHNQDDANRLLEQLQQAGISASVYH